MCSYVYFVCTCMLTPPTLVLGTVRWSLLVIPGSFPAESNSTWSPKRGSVLERDGGGPCCNLSTLEEQAEESGVQG